MLYDVGTDALESLETSTNVSMFTYTRRYQYILAFNTMSGALQSRVLRRALNMAVDKAALVREALNGRGLVSVGAGLAAELGLSRRFSHVSLRQPGGSRDVV